MEPSPTSQYQHPLVITPLSHPTLPSPSQLPRPILFLAGTTNYTSTRWQAGLIEEIALHPPKPKPKPKPISSLSTTPPFPSTPPCTIIDPYNPTWDSSWSESSSNVPFRTQVEWELDAQKTADVWVVGFCGEEVRRRVKGAGGTSLVELGVAVGGLGKEVLVCVEEGFWKEGYVEVMCGKFGVRCLKRMEDLIGVLREVIEAFQGETSDLG
ncbi:nucleoside 2-deoxyribosyltransferase domain-containing protein [Rutstroemia sp. NJR-2017a BVV2]|nr:nucleoside 2-deoxyribosyltransferase domain-containing protein [Rutstroemia sp. NJR-2017a BVV2]